MTTEKEELEDFVNRLKEKEERDLRKAAVSTLSRQIYKSIDEGERFVKCSKNLASLDPHFQKIGGYKLLPKDYKMATYRLVFSPKLYNSYLKIFNEKIKCSVLEANQFRQKYKETLLNLTLLPESGTDLLPRYKSRTVYGILLVYRVSASTRRVYVFDLIELNRTLLRHKYKLESHSDALGP